MFIRSTSPAITPSPCYSQWFLSTVLVNHCQYCISPSLSCRDVRLRIFYFQKGWSFFLIQFCLGGKGISSFANFGLCFGLCGLQMCLHLCRGLHINYPYTNRFVCVQFKTCFGKIGSVF